MIAGNVNDLIQAARDGELGLIEQVKIGDLIVSALFGLDAPESLQVTQRRIQDGSNMFSAAIDNNDTISIDIVLCNPDLSVDGALTAAVTGTTTGLTQTWRDKKKELYQMKDDREVIILQTHEEIYSGCIIQSIYPMYDVNTNWDAFFCSVAFERPGFWGATENTDSLLASALETVSGL